MQGLSHISNNYDNAHMYMYMYMYYDNGYIYMYTVHVLVVDGKLQCTATLAARYVYIAEAV